MSFYVITLNPNRYAYGHVMTVDSTFDRSAVRCASAFFSFFSTSQLRFWPRSTLRFCTERARLAHHEGPAWSARIWALAASASDWRTTSLKVRPRPTSANDGRLLGPCAARWHVASSNAAAALDSMLFLLTPAVVASFSAVMSRKKSAKKSLSPVIPSLSLIHI